MFKRKGIWLVFVLILAMIGVFAYNAYKTYTYHNPSPDSFPRFEITNEGVTIKKIFENGKEERYEASLAVDSLDFYRTIELKGRGNSTFLKQKMPFQIKFSDKVDFFGLGKARKWVLLANYYDPSHLRTSVAYYLERMLDEEYALNGKYIELYYNGENQGLYYLSPKIEIGKNRVDLRDPLGIIVEYDAIHNENKKCYTPKIGRCLTVSDLVAEDNTELAMADFMNSFNKMMEAAKHGDYETVKKYADIESLAKYYLLSEFTVNPDAYASSFYFYKDGPDDKIHAGPGWDFDYAFANRKWYWAQKEDFYSPTETEYQRHWLDGAILRLFYWLMDNTDFKSDVKKVFRERMSGKKDELVAFITQTTSEIKDYALYNNTKYETDNFTDSVTYLTDWVVQRYDYLEKIYGES